MKALLLKLLRLSLLVLMLWAPSFADAKDVGDDTVGLFRAWPEAIQIGYVRGTMGFAIYNGLACTTVRTVGEYRAALLYQPALKLEDNLPKVMLALFLRDGCVVK